MSEASEIIDKLEDGAMARLASISTVPLTTRQALSIVRAYRQQEAELTTLRARIAELEEQIKRTEEQGPVAYGEDDGEGNILWDKESCFSDDPEWLDRPMALYAAPKPAPVSVPEWFEWPHPPKRKQSSCLFDDGYEEGWAECISTLRSRLAAPSPTEKES